MLALSFGTDAEFDAWSSLAAEWAEPVAAEASPYAARPAINEVIQQSQQPTITVTYDSASIADVVAGLAEFVTRMLAQAGLETRLRPLGVDPLKLPALAAQATKQWTASFNPRPASEDDLVDLYQQAF